MDFHAEHVRPLAASGLFQQIKPSHRGRKLASPKLKPAEYFARLVDANLNSDAVQVLATLLRPRELAWWVCLCVWHAFDESAGDLERMALQRAVAWVRQPNARRLQSAQKAAREGDLSDPAFAAARTAALAGADADLHRNALIGIAVLAIQRAAARTREPDKLAQFLQLGREIAQGDRLWDIASPAPSDSDQSEGFTDWAMSSSSERWNANRDASLKNNSSNVQAERLKSVVQTLEPRFAIWWACLALAHHQEMTGRRMPAVQVKQLDQVVRWVMEPHASTPYVQDDDVSPCGQLLKAVAVAGSRAAGHTAQIAAFEAVLVATIDETSMEKRDELLADSLQFAQEIHAGKKLWPGADISARQPTGTGPGKSLDWDRWMDGSNTSD